MFFLHWKTASAMLLKRLVPSKASEIRMGNTTKSKIFQQSLRNSPRFVCENECPARSRTHTSTCVPSFKPNPPVTDTNKRPRGWRHCARKSPSSRGADNSFDAITHLSFRSTLVGGEIKTDKAKNRKRRTLLWLSQVTIIVPSLSHKLIYGHRSRFPLRAEMVCVRVRLGLPSGNGNKALVVGHKAF